MPAHDAGGAARAGWLVLGGAAVALGGAFAAMAGLGDLHARARAFLGLFTLAGVAYGIAALWVVRRPPPVGRGLAAIIGAGIVFRLILLPSAPTLSTDLYRYLWDGRLGVAGVSPYRYPPNAPEVAAFRDARVYPRLNHVDWRTVYPPGAQLLFAALARVAPDRAGAFKLAVMGFDLLTLGLLVGWLRALGRPPTWALLYAWHPLVIVELAGSGHLDAVPVAASVAALWAATRGRSTLAGALLGAGAAVKLYPLLLLAAVWRPRPVRVVAAALAVLGAAYAGYAGEGWTVLGSLGRYLGHEEFNGGVRAGLERLLGWMGSSGAVAARLLPLGGLAALAAAVAIAGRRGEPSRRALWLVGGYLLAIPNLFPWYALWIVPLLAVHPLWPWGYLSCAVALTYAVFYQPVWAIPGWVVAAEFGPLVLGLGLLAGRHPVSFALRRLAPGRPRGARAARPSAAGVRDGDPPAPGAGPAGAPAASGAGAPGSPAMGDMAGGMKPSR
ncbi:MAG TPA: glycosyltransferase 87 family protein [Methylomirabilota bacterium]|nr:glycosyltransferase 87 family protein [Methylomirabilota bacterium]